MSTLFRIFCLAMLTACLFFPAPAHALTGEMYNGFGKHVGDAKKGYIHHLPDRKHWEKVMAQPQSFTTSRTEIVKFLIDREDGWRPYFIDTNKWDIHYYFARDVLAPEYPHALFNKKEYRTPERRFIMGSLVHYLDSDRWAMEIIAGDAMSVDMLKRTYTILKHNTYFGKKIAWLPKSTIHEQRVKDLKGSIPVWDIQSFQSTIQFQPLTLGVSYGYLRIVRGKIDPATVSPDHILVTEHVPDDLPVCSGLITSKLQASLAHIALLFEGRRTPNMALRKAVDMQRFKKLEGQLVRLEITAQDYKITPAKRADAELWWDRRRPRNITYPQLIPDNIGLPDVDIIRLHDIGMVGGKAAHLGEVAQIDPPVNIPGGFVVPVHHYLNHLNKNGIQDLISKLLSDPSLEQDQVLLTKRLEAIQRVIKSMPIPDKLLADMRKKIEKFPDGKLILRSSTNAEDIEGFTGAGLYTSKIIQKSASDQELKDALRTVWASVWNLRAYQERAWYRIDHSHAAMAVLVQPFVQNLDANGVVITGNPFFSARPGYLINVQTMDKTVTGSKDGILPETLLVYTYSAELESLVLSRSTLNDGKPLLSKDDVQHAMETFKDIHQHFIPKAHEGHGKAMDIEFLLTKDKKIVIVQARPHQIVYRVVAD